MAVGYPRIVGKDNILNTWDLTASTQATSAGYPVANLASWRDDQGWRGTGSAEQWAQAANPTPYAAPGDPWDNLGLWTETDPNGSLVVASNQLQYSYAGPGANDAPNIVASPDPAVADDFAMEMLFDVTSWPTATSYQVEWLMDFDGTHMLRCVIDNSGGAARVTAAYNLGAGWVGIGNYTLGAAGTAGRIRVRRDTGGTLYAWVWDPNDTTWHSLGTHAGGAAFSSLVLDEHKITFDTQGWASGTFSVDIDGLYYASNIGINGLGVSAHDLATQGAQVRLDASVGGVGWDTLVPAFYPPNDRTLAKFFTSGPWNYYRLVIPTGYASPPTISILVVAPYLEIPSLPNTPHDPDGQEDIGASMISSEGHYLGSVVEGTMRKQDWVFEFLPHAFVDDEWLPFLASHARKPFIFLWDPVNKPLEAYFMWITDRVRAQPYNQVWRSITLALAGVYEP